MEFADYVRSLNLVPVSISYENDPCDIAKARELYEKATQGSYEKGEFEDIESIIQGIVVIKAVCMSRLVMSLPSHLRHQKLWRKRLTDRSTRTMCCSQSIA